MVIELKKIIFKYNSEILDNSENSSFSLIEGFWLWPTERDNGFEICMSKYTIDEIFL